MAQYGQTDWDLVGNENKNKDFKKDMYLRLQDGPNRIRIVTKPFQYLAHTYKKEGDKGFGQKVYCSAPMGSCPLCEKGDKANASTFFSGTSPTMLSWTVEMNFPSSPVSFHLLYATTRATAITSAPQP